MTEGGDGPERPLRLLEHGGFFEVRSEAPMREFEAEGSDAGYSMVYDGQPEPKLSVELDGDRTVIGVETGEVLEGFIAEDELALTLAIIDANAGELSEWWRETHERIESLKDRLRELASGLTDPNDIEIDEE